MASIPFPDDVCTAPLTTISLEKLIKSDEEEQGRIYDASKKIGFFYLDLQECPEGRALLQSANSLFDVARDVFDLPLTVKQEFDFAAEGKYFGYKGIGAEVVDGSGTRDRNEIYNVSISYDRSTCSRLISGADPQR